MPRDGSTGQYNLPAGNPYVNGTVIDETVVNATMSDLGTALTNSIAKDGQTTVTGNIPMGGFKLTNVATGTAANQNPAISQIQDGSLITLGSVSGTDTITGALSPAITSYATRMPVTFTPANNNTGAATIAINGLAAKSIVKGNAAALVAGDLVTTCPALLLYDGTNFVLLNPQHNVPDSEVTTARMENDAVTNTKLANMASATVKGQTSGGSGDPVDLTAAQLVTIINTADGAGTGLDSDLLDGQHGSFYQSAANLNAGTLPDARVAQSNVTQHQAALALAASQVTSGTFADARIAASNVAQHVAKNISAKAGISKTLSTSAPSGGSDGDIWYRY